MGTEARKKTGNAKETGTVIATGIVRGVETATVFKRNRNKRGTGVGTGNRPRDHT
jgi:hypothetical protein